MSLKGNNMLGGKEVSDIDDVDFYLEVDGAGYTSVHADDLFEVYDVLEPALQSNYERNRETSRHRSAMASGNRVQEAKDKNQDVIKAVEQDWAENLDRFDAYAEVSFNGETEVFDLYPRRDFGTGQILSKPNVMFLEGRNSNRKMALRHWRPNSSEMISWVGETIGGFKRGQHDDEFFDTLGTEDYNPDDMTESMVFVDERELQTALNKEEGVYDLFRDHDHFAPVTPNRISLVDTADNGSAYALRPFMMKEFDGGPDDKTDAKRFGEYYANIANLGMMNYFDREPQKEFVADCYPGFEGNFTVSVDNEYVAAVKSPLYFQGGTDYKSHVKEIRKALIEELGEPESVAESFIRHWSDSFQSTFPELPDIELLEHVPRGFDSDLFSEDKKVSTRV